MDSVRQTLSQNAKVLRSKVGKHAIYGLFFALISIFVASSLVAYISHQTVSLEGILQAQKSNPAIWFLDLTPFLFAFWGQYISSVLSYEASAMVLDQTTELRLHTSALETQVMHNMTHDSLTGLPNPILFNDRLNQALSLLRGEKSHLGVLIISMSQLQEINKSLGRYNGDRILNQCAVRLTSVVQEPNTVARLNNDLFGILLPRISGLDDVKDFIKKINHVMKNPFLLEDLSLQLHTNIGVVLSPEHGTDADTLLQRAEVAMSAARHDHEEYLVYLPELDKDSQRRLILMSDLQRALSGEGLMLYYQPKVDLKTKEIAAEALLRWQHPQFGLISPEDFIPLAERTGLIKAVSYWVMSKGIEQCAQWHKKGLPVGVSINLSTLDLMDIEFPDKISGKLASFDADPQYIKFEITEGAIMKDQDRALENLMRIVKLGVSISIDDFGTGYSSLAYLSKLPANELKIDKSFILGLAEKNSDIKIVKATIDLAHNLMLKVVAEGVETEAVLKQLRTLGCDAVQGTFISAPLSVSEFESWYASFRSR